MIQLENISIGYDPARPILSGLNLEAGQGEMLALVGRNGSGKSTLLKSILGILPLISGTCYLKGNPILNYSKEGKAKTISFVASQAGQLPSMSMRELISLGRLPYTGWSGRLTPTDHEQVEKAAAELNLIGLLDKNISELSDGERQRAMIARSLAQDTDVIVLDEPAAFLDIPNKYELVRILSAFRAKSKTIVYSTHDLETAMMSADKFWIINEKKIHQGSPEDLGLSGLFDSLFSASGIVFDPASGRFRAGSASRGEMFLDGEGGMSGAWTAYAVQRAGYYVKSGSGYPRVAYLSENVKNKWKYSRKKEGESVHFGSLYDLARFLSQKK